MSSKSQLPSAWRRSFLSEDGAGRNAAYCPGRLLQRLRCVASRCATRLRRAVDSADLCRRCGPDGEGQAIGQARDTRRTSREGWAAAAVVSVRRGAARRGGVGGWATRPSDADSMPAGAAGEERGGARPRPARCACLSPASAAGRNGRASLWFQSWAIHSIAKRRPMCLGRVPSASLFAETPPRITLRRVQVGLEPLLEAGDRLPQTPALPKNDALRPPGPNGTDSARRGLPAHRCGHRPPARRQPPRAWRRAAARRPTRQTAAISGTPGR